MQSLHRIKNMDFINPKTDFAFKKIFGSSDSKDILISFLNALLYQGKAKIKDLEIIDPYSPGKVAILKDSYLDVRATLKDNTMVIVEMQVWRVADFEQRILYNAAKAYANQLGKGEGYSKLKPLIALTLTDFVLFPEQDMVISNFVFKERSRELDFSTNPYIELVFVELPNFKKELSQLSSLTDKWIYFMKHAIDLQMVPETMGEVSEIQKAFAIANEANFNREELEDLEKREMFLEDQKNLKRAGVLEGQQDLLIRQLGRRIGSVEPQQEIRIRYLSLAQLESLSDAILDFTTASDLSAWLDNVRN